jgi:hypothetical protein
MVGEGMKWMRYHLVGRINGSYMPGARVVSPATTRPNTEVNMT